MQRPERVILIGISAAACGITGLYAGGDQKWNRTFFGIEGLETIVVFTFPLVCIAVLANFTAFQRLRACYKYIQESENNSK